MINAFRRYAPLAILAACGLAAPAAELAKDQPASASTPVKLAPPKKVSIYDQMDYGPFLSASFISSPTAEYNNGPGSFNVDSTARGIIIKLEDNWNTGIVFDADTMRMSVGWHGGPLWLRGLIGDGDHGWSPMPRVLPTFLTPNGPGWANADGSFEDPRANSISPLPRPGPLPKDRAH